MTQCPTKPGEYLCKCEESMNEWYLCNVYHKAGDLVVNDPHIGESLLSHYHDSLIDIEWSPALRTESCEWNPETNTPAFEDDPWHGWTVYSVGTRKNYHLSSEGLRKN